MKSRCLLSSITKIVARVSGMRSFLAGTIRQFTFSVVLAVAFVASVVDTALPTKSGHEFKQIFDGKSLENWSNPDMSYWSVVNGTLIGRSSPEHPAARNQYLVWKGGEVTDFELKLKFGLSGGMKANSGIQFRSQFSADATETTGYQADIALESQFMGCLYDEGTGRKILAGRGEKAIIDEFGNRESGRFADAGRLYKVLRLDDWNDYHLIVRGNHFQAFINGHLMSEVIDTEKKHFHPAGRLALQVHAGQSTEVKFKDIFLKPYPSANPSALPESLEEAAAEPETLTPANGALPTGEYRYWHRSQGDASSSRFSTLDQINRDNVKNLRVAWTYHSKDGVGDLQCNPIVVNGILYGPTPGNFLVAVDAQTGAEVWRFNPGGRFTAKRGLVYWKGDAQSAARILFNSGDFLFALNPETGKPIENFGDRGKVRTGPVAAAGSIYRNVLVIPGWYRDVFGFDIRTGKPLWTFHTVPHPGEFGAETWKTLEQGANVWGGASMDEQRGIAYVATGSPKPNFLGMGHRGRNLFANCVIAINAVTGERLWHFQEIRHDIWDLDIPAPPNLVTITRNGKKIDAVAQVTKLGNLLLLDRVSGRPIFPFRLRRAPASIVPGEMAWPYQPDPQLPEPFSARTFTLEEVTDRSPEAREYILQRLANAAMGWFRPFEAGRANALYGVHGGALWPGAAFDPESRCVYITVNKMPWIITLFRTDETPLDPKAEPTAGHRVYREHCASCHGPERKGGFAGEAPPLQGLRHHLNDAQVLAIVKNGDPLMPAIELTEQQQKDLLDFLFLRDRPATTDTQKSRPREYSFNAYPRLLDQDGYPGCKPPWGNLVCMNLDTGKIVWRSLLGEYEELSAQGIPQTGTPNIGGAMVTAGGLVFAAGTRDNKIRAFDKTTGKQLWEHKLPFGGFAPPSTYEVNGRQFVVIAATGGGFPGANKIAGSKEKGDTYVAFALP